MTKSADLQKNLMTASQELGALIAALPLTDLGNEELAAVVSGTRLVQRQCVAVLIGAAAKASTHAKAGVGPPVDDVLSDGSAASKAEVYRDRLRSQVAASFPAVGRAVESGSVFPENLDVLARVTSRMTPQELAALAEYDTQLASAAGRLGVESFRKKVQRRRDRIRADHGHTAQEQAKAEQYASVSVSRDKHMHRLNAGFDTINGTAVGNAHQSEYLSLCDRLGNGHGLTSDEISAQALHDLIIRGANTPATHDNNRPTVNIHVITDGQTLSTGPHDQSIIETVDGMPLCPEILGRLTCDCIIERIDSLPDGSVNVSRSVRTATPKQKVALRALYDSCPISGETWDRLEIHHVKFVSQGGETKLSNLLPISRRWHHLVHDQGWQLEMEPNRTLHLYRPDGTHHQTIAPPVPVLHRTQEDEETTSVLAA